MVRVAATEVMKLQDITDALIRWHSAIYIVGPHNDSAMEMDAESSTQSRQWGRC
jgi:hypothetical protein